MMSIGSFIHTFDQTLSVSALTLIKTIHTAIWLFFNVVIFYLLYAVITDRIDRWVWICIGLILLEGIVLLIFKNVCPVTKVAQRYSDSDKANFDIFLPEWLARHNKTIYTGIVAVALLILAWRLIAQ
jgi:NhaP-type Na+/H+ or K+/H+ antiporter